MQGAVWSFKQFGDFFSVTWFKWFQNILYKPMYVVLSFLIRTCLNID